jgi:hypothetical protein
MIHEDMGPALLPFIFDSKWGQTQVFSQFPDLVMGEHDPKAGLDEVGHFVM